MTRTRPSIALLAVLLPVAGSALSLLEEPPGLADVPVASLAPMEAPLPCAPAPAAIEEAATGAEIAAEAQAAAEPAPTKGTAPQAAAAEAEDDPAIKAEVEAESRELEAVEKAAEAAGVGTAPAPGPKPEATPAAPGEDRIAELPELDHGLAKLQAEYDIPIDVNADVVQWVRFFQSPFMHPHFARWLERYYRYEARYRAILKEHGLPEDTIFLAMIESGFANFAYSRARASGPWQFIAPTGRRFGLTDDFWVDERRDPEKAAHAAARYLAELREQTGDWRLAWAGYNAGAGTILRAQARGAKDFWEMTQGRVLRKETKGYVPKLMAAAIVTKHREAFGFGDDQIQKQAWVETDEVDLDGAVLLQYVARAAGVAEKELMELNPALRRAVTPPRAFKLKLPKGAAEAFAQAWPELAPKARANFAGHVVRRGDTLGSIAGRYGTQVEGIMQLNGLSSARRLRVGQELLIPVARGGARPEAVAAAVASKAEPARAAGRKPSAAAKLAGTPIMEPAGVHPPAKPIHGVRHVVQDGDTLWSISQRSGVDVGTLCRWNGIRNPRRHTLRIGTELVVKAGG